MFKPQLQPRSGPSWELGSSLLLAAEQQEDYMLCSRAHQHLFFKGARLLSEIIHEKKYKEVWRCINAMLSLQLLFDICFIKPLIWISIDLFDRQVQLVWPMNMDACFELLERKVKSVHICMLVFVRMCQCSYFTVIQSCLIMQVEFIAFSLVGYL